MPTPAQGRPPMTTPQEILHFWFEELSPEMHFSKNAEIDQTIRNRFLEIHTQILEGRTKEWRKTPEGRLAEIIVLDQFSRNMFRETPLAFASDALALELAQAAVKVGDDQKLPPEQRRFLYMPYMHSENREIHEVAAKLFSQKGLEENLKFELLHKKIIDRFGRYPHRNEVLKRKSTQEELDFLKTDESSF
jgi:uncharacterized protein (DUF924 family)